MTTKLRTRLIKEGNYLAEVDVTLLYDIEPWAPHLSKEDALKLDRVKKALRANDLESAAKEARIYDVVPRAAASHA